MPKRKADEKTLAHLLLSLSHALECLLLVVHLLVLGHVGLVAEVIEVARIGF